MERVASLSASLEALIDKISTPIRPYLPVVARFLLVVTFLEDSLRIVTQWDDQTYYLERHRGFPWGIAHLFLMLNVVAMTTCSVLAIAKKRTEVAVSVLFGVIVAQSVGYGLIFDGGFFLRNLSVAGGLLLLVFEAWSSRSKKNIFPTPFMSVSETDKAAYLALFGRILLVCLFLSFILAGEWSLLRVVISIIAFAACVMVVVGFKAKWTAGFMVMFLSVSNVLLNNWWSLHHLHPSRDFLKYDFFQTLSIMGGFLLLSNLGPGTLSHLLFSFPVY